MPASGSRDYRQQCFRVSILLPISTHDATNCNLGADALLDILSAQESGEKSPSQYRL